MSREPIFRRLANQLRKRTSRRAKRPPRKRFAQGRRDFFEALEDRSLLSATYLPINPTGSASPTDMAALGGQVLFAANDGTHGVELWKSDGTISGTVMVADINPGTTLVGGVTTPNSSNPTDLVTVGGYVYFAANNGADGTQLWRSDGTTGGTSMVTDLNAAGGGIDPADLTSANGRLYFIANDGTDGNQVWISDGTGPGTTMISDLAPASGAANPAQLIPVGGTVYFTANAGSTGVQLYATNGTLATTHIVLNVTNGGTGASPTYLTNVNGTLFYAGYDSVHGNQLWKSDGTATGTVMVAAIGSGTASSNPTNLTNVNGAVFFAANDGTHGVQLWKSDGTAAGTQMVSDINTTAPGASSYPADLTNVGGVLFFRANDGVHGTQLWRSDGTAAGTTMVLAINSGAVGSTPDNLTAANGNLYFTANDGIHGFEPWQSDGTVAGTTLLADIYPGPPSSSPAYLTSAGNTLFMAANDGTHGVSLYAAPIPAPKPTVADNTFYFTAGQTLGAAAPGVLAGATSAPGATLTATLVSGPAHGALTLNSDGSFSYTPAAGFDGKDTFTITASDGAGTAMQPATVTLESLDYRWVAKLYTDVLGRPPGAESDAEVNYWVNQIAAGASRMQIAEMFFHSNEFYARLVNGYYETALGHVADPGGLSFFVGELDAGVSTFVVFSQIVSSPEFQARSGTTNGYISNVYGAMLNRLPSSSELSYWVTQANAGESPLAIALSFTRSPEYINELINSYYEQYLNRPADSVAQANWLAAIQSGVSEQTFGATLAASNEFYA